MRVPVRSLLGIVAAPVTGYAVYWSVFYLESAIEGVLRKPVVLPDHPVGFSPSFAWFAFAILPFLSCVAAGVVAVRVSQSGSRLFAAVAGLAVGCSPLLLAARYDAQMGGFCLSLAVVTFLACIVSKHAFATDKKSQRAR